MSFICWYVPISCSYFLYLWLLQVLFVPLLTLFVPFHLNFLFSLFLSFFATLALCFLFPLLLFASSAPLSLCATSSLQGHTYMYIFASCK